MSPSHLLHHVVIIGGGAGGLELAVKLGNKFGKRNKARITLVDRTLTHLWKPLLHEVAAGTLNSYEDEFSYLALAHKNHFTFCYGKMDILDRAQQKISVAPMSDDNKEDIPRQTLTYDTLIFAVGSQTNDFGIKGVKKHCMFLDNRVQADAFHQYFLRNAYTVHAQPTPLREGQFKIAISGGGATGVELAAELHEAAGHLFEFGLHRLPEMKITLIEAADRLLPQLSPDLSERTAHTLAGINIEVLCGHRIIEATATDFITDKGQHVPAEIKVWTAGIKAPDFLADMDGLETNHINQLAVHETLQTTRDSNIFAFGDCAACPIPGTDKMTPPRAQAAHQQANILVTTVNNRLKHAPLPNYRYTDYGSLINLSRYSAIGNIMGNLFGKKFGSIMFEGLLARIFYLSLYKMHQLVIQGFLPVVLTTLANFLSKKTKPRMKLH